MSDTVDGNGLKARIGQNDLVLVQCRRIPLQGGFKISIQVIPDPGNCLHELHGNLSCFLIDQGLAYVFIRMLAFLLVGQYNCNLFLQVIDNVFNPNRDIRGQVIALENLITIVTGEDDTKELCHNQSYRFLIRLTVNRHLIDISFLLIIHQNIIY